MPETVNVQGTPPAPEGVGTVPAEQVTSKPGLTSATASTEKKEEAALFAGKYKSVDELVAGYKALEAKLGQGKPSATEAPQVQPPAAAKTVTDVQAAGFDLTALSQEFVQNGNKLSDATLQQLATKGFTAETVGTIVQGQVALATQIAEDIASVAGGRQQLAQTLEWAKANGTEQQRATLAAAQKAGDPSLVKLALAPIVEAHRRAVGTDAAVTVQAQPPASSGVKPFLSWAEVTTAMSDKRYKNGDVSYRKEIEGRLRASSI